MIINSFLDCVDWDDPPLCYFVDRINNNHIAHWTQDNKFIFDLVYHRINPIEFEVIWNDY